MLLHNSRTWIFVFFFFWNPLDIHLGSSLPSPIFSILSDLGSRWRNRGSIFGQRVVWVSFCNQTGYAAEKWVDGFIRMNSDGVNEFLRSLTSLSTQPTIISGAADVAAHKTLVKNWVPSSWWKLHVVLSTLPLHSDCISVGAKGEETVRKFGNGLDACIIFHYSPLLPVQKVQKW